MTHLPNTTHYTFLKLPTGTDLSHRRLPYMKIASSTIGPTVWITGCAHGDEVGGMVVIQELFKKLKRTPLLKGAVHAFPLMNPIGFETGSRAITITQEDLNRCFPGDPHGSLGQRMAHSIFSTITSTTPDLVLDLHTDWTRSIPYAILDAPSPTLNPEIYRKAHNFTLLTGFPVVQDTEDLQSSLSHALLATGIPALTMELGESRVINEHNINSGLKAIRNVLAFLGMIAPQDNSTSFHEPLPAAVQGQTLRYGSQPFSTHTGIVRFLVKPGDVVAKGQIIGRIANAFGKVKETLVAPHKALVLGHSDSAVTFPGSPLMDFGIIND